jgi:hypothetical protein
MFPLPEQKVLKKKLKSNKFHTSVRHIKNWKHHFRFRQDKDNFLTLYYYTAGVTQLNFTGRFGGPFHIYFLA